MSEFQCRYKRKLWTFRIGLRRVLLFLLQETNPDYKIEIKDRDNHREEVMLSEVEII